MGSSGAIKLGDRFFEVDGDDSGAPRVLAISCGPLAQLWVRDVERRLQRHELEALCPGFVQALADHPAVECVITREGDELVVQGRYGTAYLRLTPRDAGPDAGSERPDPVLRVEGTNPLEIYDEPGIVARQIASFASMEECGDLICFAASFQPDSLRDATPGALGERHVYTFENQLGTHASVGGDQGYPFIMLHRSVDFDPSGIVEASDLYPFLNAYVQRDARPPRSAGAAPRTGQGGPSVPSEREHPVTI